MKEGKKCRLTHPWHSSERIYIQCNARGASICKTQGFTHFFDSFTKPMNARPTAALARLDEIECAERAFLTNVQAGQALLRASSPDPLKPPTIPAQLSADMLTAHHRAGELFQISRSILIIEFYPDRESRLQNRRGALYRKMALDRLS
jgi:hypothetical protein